MKDSRSVAEIDAERDLVTETLHCVIHTPCSLEIHGQWADKNKKELILLLEKKIGENVFGERVGVFKRMLKKLKA